MSRRTDQIASTLQRAAQEAISRGFQDPRIRGLITVTSVTVAEDLKTARVYVSVMPKEHQQLALHGLRSAAAHIRRRMGELVSMRQVPHLNIRLDEGIQSQGRVYEALSKVAEERLHEPEQGGLPPAEPPERDDTPGGEGA